MHKIRNPVWLDKQKGVLDCELMVDNTWLPFTANIASLRPLGAEIVKLARDGVYGDIPHREATNSPQLSPPIFVDKSKFLTTLIEMNFLAEESVLESAQKNQLPQEWAELSEKLEKEHQLTAKISFAADQKISEYTNWVQLMIHCGALNIDQVRAAILASF